MRKIWVGLVSVFLCLMSACSAQHALATPVLNQETYLPEDPIITPTPFKPVFIEDEPNIDLTLWIPDYLEDIQFNWEEHSQIIISEAREDAVCTLQAGNKGNKIGYLTLALVTPFNTIQDELSIEQINKVMIGDDASQSTTGKLFVSESVYSVVSESLGNLSGNVVIVPEDELFLEVSRSSENLGLVRFDYLAPHWKVMRIANISPLDKRFDSQSYYFNLPISVVCMNDELSQMMIDQLKEEYTNRSEEKITSILMTGTTALTRATADRMEKFGTTYPGVNIKFWFDNSDIRHVSSETSFYAGCPPPNPVQKNLVFCSDPKYLELFTFLQVDIIELTGNHLLDKGIGPFENTLDLLNQTGFNYYAAGFSKEEAQSPLLLEHNGNKFAFFGCNPAGPANVWATDSRGGVNNCDYAEMTDQIRALKQEGYLPIVTFQYFESNSMRASTTQMKDFREMVDAGAVIVSGSQSHVPMSMEIYHQAFIHYGLGNLFFDQMDSIINRQEFLDRHIFYDGRYIGTELMTAMLENYAQPRPMTPSERASLLEDAFRNFTFMVEENE